MATKEMFVRTEFIHVIVLLAKMVEVVIMQKTLLTVLVWNSMTEILVKTELIHVK